LKKIAFINGQVLNQQKNTMERTNLLLVNDLLVGMGYLPTDDEKDTEVYDLQDKIIVPDITDSLVNIHEPGNFQKETIKTASFAAAEAGITRLIMNSSTEPCLDNHEIMNYLQNNIKQNSSVNIQILGKITKQGAGEELAEMGLMYQHGALAFTDDAPISNHVIMENALKYSHILNTPLIIRPKSYHGVIHEGYYSTILGLPCMSPTDEHRIISRDLALLARYGGKLHFSPISSAKSVDIIRQAKAEGLQVTCGTTPHHLYLTDADLDGYQTNIKVNPPVRSQTDQKALIAGIKDGTIDIITSDHTPCIIDEKRTDFITAEFGISGIDLLLPLVITKLYVEEKMELNKIFKLLSLNPQKIFGLPAVKIAITSKPSFTIIDLKESKKIEERDLNSIGKNTPFIGNTLKGFATTTVVDGKVINNKLKTGVHKIQPSLN